MAKILVNTEYFSEAANDYRKNKGVYTKAPFKSREFMEYWGEQKRRCLQGYEVGGTKITGRHYWYLNFCPIKRTEEDKDPLKKEWNVMKEKELLFPKFWLVDYEWWWAKEIAMRGMLKEQVAQLELASLPVQDYLDGKHLVCAKTRRAGFSYKEAADGAYNYNFIPRSKSYFFASSSEYLVVDGILNKFEVYLEHLDKNTQSFWKKNRMEKSSLSDMHWKSSYIDSNKRVKGYQSEVIGVTITNPNKVRGKDGVKITFEEAGSFKDLLSALAIALPSVKDGKTMTGQISVFGTGGEEGPAIEGLETLMYNPDTYDMLAFNNIWEEGMETTKVGYFVPCYLANQDFMDENGNVDLAGAIAHDDSERAKKKASGNAKDLDRRVAEFPRTIDEALARSSKSIFNRVESMRKHLKALKSNQDVLSSIRHGTLVETTKGVTFVVDSTKVPITTYPHKQTDDLSGAVSIYYPPAAGEEYLTVVDPYYKDGAADLTSLWACYVVKKPSKGNALGGQIAATFVGRPDQLETCYEYSYLLAKLYKSKIQSEIQGGGHEFFKFLKRKGELEMVCFEPILATSKEIIAERNRKYFMNVTTESKRTGFSGFANWFEQIVGLDENGDPIYRFQMCSDVGLLEECVKWRDGGNYDRISAMVIYFFMLQDLELEEAQRAQAESGRGSHLLDSIFSSSISSNEYDIVEDVLGGSSYIGDDIFNM